MSTITSLIIKPKIRGFICFTAHPTGCALHVQEQVDYIKKQDHLKDGPKKVLIIGASTGYGLASRITAAFGSGADTLGVYYEKLPENGKPASAGYYNSQALEKLARKSGLYSKSINGDAFADNTKQEVIDLIKQDLGTVDAVIYSLASPRRIHPKTGKIYNSALKPIGQSFTAKTLDTDREIVKDITIEPASPEEIADTIAVMGGEDWQIWLEALLAANVLTEQAKTIAYSYIGPRVTWPIYRDGTIGKAKLDLEKGAQTINSLLAKIGGKAYVSINKALVTQASSAIPVVPLYLSLLYRIMKEKGTHEGCIEQIHRLFATQLYSNKGPSLDEHNRIRIDDLEMDPDTQQQVEKLWIQVNTENLRTISDIAGYKAEFLKLFGFGLNGVDYDAEVNPNL